MQREFGSFGHQFHLRSGHLDEDYRHSQRAPIFLQFLDCVYQLLQQFPTHFQFNSRMLAEMAHATYTNRFGTFSFHCVKDQKDHNAVAKTLSVWTYLLGSPAVPPPPAPRPCPSVCLCSLWMSPAQASSLSPLSLCSRE